MKLCKCGHERRHHWLLDQSKELSCIFVNDYITGSEHDTELDVCLCLNFSSSSQGRKNARK